MITLEKEKKQKKETHTSKKSNSDNKLKPSTFLLVFIGLFSLIMLFNNTGKKKKTLLFEEVVTKNDNGWELSPNRVAKLNSDTMKMDNAEQYVLRASITGIYPCPSCPYRDSIFLNKNEIYRYGITINGEKGRYGNLLNVKNLNYFTQYKGDLKNCLIEERKRIIRYPLLQENLRRDNPIARPPGNYKDD